MCSREQLNKTCTVRRKVVEAKNVGRIFWTNHRSSIFTRKYVPHFCVCDSLPHGMIVMDFLFITDYISVNVTGRRLLYLSFSFSSDWRVPLCTRLFSLLDILVPVRRGFLLHLTIVQFVSSFQCVECVLEIGGLFRSRFVSVFLNCTFVNVLELRLVIFECRFENGLVRVEAIMKIGWGSKFEGQKL